MYYSPYRGGTPYPPVHHGMYPPPQSLYWHPPQQPQQQAQQQQESTRNEQQSEKKDSAQTKTSQQPNQQQYPHHFHGGYVGPGYPPPYSRPGPGFLSAFKTEDGKFDFDKASNTLDQVVNLGNQISPIVKQVGGLFKK
ncbi:MULTISPECIES: YppG family protein [Bacillaceae]|uniref:YppG family protein n=1 Tax=Evansella alkalicola TaxID=745819 RepID=A0ABS6JPP4_9BACI|nr:MULTISPECIES: YppG family protein [Bacillaceae]MBU9720529.1 YppG family protein [Bacillus alkalicola]